MTRPGDQCGADVIRKVHVYVLYNSLWLVISKQYCIGLVDCSRGEGHLSVLRCIVSMGSGEAKRFRDLYSSAGRHGDSFWKEEKDNVGMKLLKSMGWDQGQGLGKDGNGRTTAVKQFRKKDNAGIGSASGTRDEAYRASQDLFNDVLSRLSGGGDGEDGSKELGSGAGTVKGMVAKRQLTRRFVRGGGGAGGQFHGHVKPTVRTHHGRGGAVQVPAPTRPLYLPRTDSTIHQHLTSRRACPRRTAQPFSVVVQLVRGR